MAGAARERLRPPTQGMLESVLTARSAMPVLTAFASRLTIVLSRIAIHDP